VQKANYIVSKGLGGGLFWALDFDDFTGTFCGNGKYPLINQVKSIFNNQSNLQTTKASSSKSPTTTKLPVTKITTKSLKTTILSSASSKIVTTTKLPTVSTNPKTTKPPVTIITTKSLKTTILSSASSKIASTSKSPTVTPSGGKCSNGDRYYAIQGCTGYYQCIYSGTANQLVTAVIYCPSGLLFDAKINTCNWATSVLCTV